MTDQWNSAGLVAMLSRLLAALALAPALAAAQQTVDIEYYLAPEIGGTNQMVFEEPSIQLSADLTGTVLTFTNDPFAGQFRAGSTVTATVDVNALLPDLSSVAAGTAVTITLEGGTYRIASPEGEIIDGTLGDQSTLELRPYPRVPRVMFFELALVPATTTVQGGPPGIDLAIGRMMVWGLLLTNGLTFEGARAFPNNHQYDIRATY